MHTFIDRIITFSLRNKFFIFFLTVIAVIAGAVSFLHTPVDAFPACDEHEGDDHYPMAGTERGGDREVHHDPGRDSHESGTEEDGYPEYDTVRAVGHPCDV